MKSRAVVPGNPGHHAVQFYSDEHRLCLSVADFLADGIVAGQPIVMIATPEHRQAIVTELTARRFEVARLLDSGAVLVLDAYDTLDRFMDGSRPDPVRFNDLVGSALNRVSARGKETVVRAYGEMVDVLWRAGKCESAIKLELLWNNLAGTHDFSLLCGYAMGNFYKQASRGMQDVCALHTHAHAAEAM